MNVLVTGGSGYFGSLLVQRLLQVGHRCRIFDLVDTADRPTSVDFVLGDIRDLDAIGHACSSMDVVFHNVAQVPLAKDRHLFESVNILGTRNLLDACKKTGIAKMVYTSSSAVFGVPKTNPVTEATQPTPMEAYGHAKREGELLCAEYAKQGLDITIIRPRTILGHGRLGIFQILFEWVRTGCNIPVLGDGQNVYQFVHADDLARACILAAEKKGCSIYNCGAEKYGTMQSAMEALCRYAGTGSKVVNIPMAPAVVAMKLTSAMGLSPLGPYHALMYGQSMYFDISRAKTELKWQPRYSNEEMFIESYDWYLEHKDTLAASGPASPHRSPVRQGILKLVKYIL